MMAVAMARERATDTRLTPAPAAVLPTALVVLLLVLAVSYDGAFHLRHWAPTALLALVTLLARTRLLSMAIFPWLKIPPAELLAERELCHLGGTETAFVEAVDDALDEHARPDPVRAAARRAFALNSGWGQRVADFASLLDDPDTPS